MGVAEGMEVEARAVVEAAPVAAPLTPEAIRGAALMAPLAQRMVPIGHIVVVTIRQG